MNLIKINGGLLELLLLNALKEDKAYGYELMNRFAPVYKIPSGVIYLALKSLCEKGLIRRDNELFAGRIRVYYIINKKGKIRLDDLLDELDNELENLEKFL